MEKEIIVVDDCSTDESVAAVEEFQQRSGAPLRLIRHERNQGKGAAIRTAVEHATGDFAIFQDADLEYDPNEYGRLLRPLLADDADAVFGSRFAAREERRVLYYWHAVANRWLTWMANVASDLNLTDMETCYKAFRTPLLKSIPIRSERFGIEPELTIKLAQRKARIYEVPISYHGRTYDEGKKIGLADAFEAVWVILRFSLVKDIYTHSGGHTLDALEEAFRFNRWMADTVRPWVGARVLEIGAGIGNLTSQLVSRRKLYVASDLDAEHLARLATRFQRRPQLQVRKCDLSQPDDFADLQGKFDAVVCFNVLEHIEDDLQGLRNIFGALEPGGRAIVLVPHDQRIYGTLDEALGHYRRYSHQELQERMEQTGFRVDRILEFNRISRYPWYLSGRVFRQRRLGGRQMAIFDKLVWLWRRIDRYLPWPPVSIIAIGVKPAEPQ